MGAIPFDTLKLAHSLREAAKLTPEQSEGFASVSAKPSTTPSPGDKAPDFELTDDSGAKVSLGSFGGKKLVLYFYPKDDTSGCTKEAIDFNNLRGEFEQAGAVILGVSPD